MHSSIEAYIRQHLRFNFIIGMFDGGFFGMGVGFASFAAVIPLFVHHLTESALLIGLVPAIHNMGWQLPQLLTADWVARSKRYKPLVLWMTIHERVPYLGLAVVAFLLPRLTNQTALFLIFGMLVWQGFGAGMAANPWTSMVSKVMPNELHGTFFGSQSAAYNGLAAVSAVLAGLILENVAGPVNFSLCFALTFLCMVVSFLFLSFTREPESQTGDRLPGNPVWKKSLEILKENANFRSFLWVRILSQFAGMAFSFYIIYAVNQFGMSDATGSIMVSILMVGQIVLSPLMGRWGDRSSHRSVMVLGGIGAALSSFLAWCATSESWFYPIFILQAAATVAIWTIPLAYSVSFAKKPEDRPLYIGLANTIPAPATILAPVIGGWLADAMGFNVTFIVSAVFGLLMAFLLIRMRNQPA